LRQETYQRWLASFEIVKPKHEAAAAKLKTTCCEFGAKQLEALPTK
jgi:hypothetical protein